MDQSITLKLIEQQSTKKSTYLKQDIFKDDLFKHDLNSIGDLEKKNNKDLDPMKNIPNSIRKRIEAKNSTNYPNKIREIVDISHPSNRKKYVWKRIGEVINEFNLLKIRSNSPSDQLIFNIIQGHLGNCYFISAISAFSEQSVYILNLFPEHYDTKTKTFQVNANGLYGVQVYVNGKPIRIIIDDFFPCLPVNSNKDENQAQEKYELAFSIVDKTSRNIWPLVLEKAWSKVNGSFANIISGNIPEAFQFISPSPVLTYKNSIFFPDKLDRFHHIIKEADDKNQIICGDISENISPTMKILTTAMGLLSNHAYSVISIVELNMRDGEIEKILRIRNPWGSLEWNGDWSDNSLLWNDEFKKKAGYTDKDDGTFCMSLNDYLKFFTTTYVCAHQLTSIYTYQKIKNKEKNSFFYFVFDIKKDVDGFFVLNFKSTKIRQHLKNEANFENYYYSLYLFKQTSVGRNKYEYTLMHSSISNLERKSIKINEEGPGKFILMVKLNNYDEQSNQKEFIYSMEKFITEKLDKKVNFKLGLYANVNENDYSIETIESKNLDPRLIKEIFSNSVDKIMKALPHDTYTNFFDENQKDSFRVLHFENEKTAFGIFSFNNESSALIMEKIGINDIQNLCYVPILDEEIKQNVEKIELKNKSPNEVDLEENIFDDDNENEYLKHIGASEKFESSVELVTQQKNPRVSLDKNKELFYKIKPYSKFYGVLFKNSENTDFDINSRICLKYPLSQVWHEKLFDSKKTKLKFKDTHIPIIETIVKFNNGLLVKYKNKTNDFIAEVKIKLQNAKNIKANKENFKFIEKMYGEEAEGIIKINDDGSCMMVINPGEMVFIEFSAIDLFEEVSYEINFSYNIYTV